MEYPTIESIPHEIWWDALTNRQSRKLIIKTAKKQFPGKYDKMMLGEAWDSVSYNRFESPKEPLFLKYSDIEKEIAPFIFKGPASFERDGIRYIKHDFWTNESGKIIRWLYYSFNTQMKERCFVENDWD